MSLATAPNRACYVPVGHVGADLLSDSPSQLPLQLVLDRLKPLLEDTAGTTGTRFLLVTHHRLTMARMHRLFGVTMAERGISQIVSVDLRGAERIRATA